MEKFMFRMPLLMLMKHNISMPVYHMRLGSDRLLDLRLRHHGFNSQFCCCQVFTA